jgi:hypothetical protein
MTSGRLLAVSIASVSVSCSQEPRQWRLELGSTTDSVDDNGARKIEMQAGETTNLELVVIGSPSNSIAFEADGLPPFATLSGPILKLAPGRPDAGSYTFTLTAKAGHDSSSAKVELVIHRFNNPPKRPMLMAMRDDTGPRLIGGCPGLGCTALGTARLDIIVCDDDGDGMTVDAEVVLRGQAFSGVPTHSATIAAGYAAAVHATCATLVLPLAGLAIDQSYDFALRVSDEFGAVYKAAEAPKGWLFSPGIWTFDQGPCVNKQCACAPSGPAPCGLDPHMCCSGVCIYDGVSQARCQ